MSYVGTVANGVVVLPPEVRLDDGTKVRVEPLAAEPAAQTLGQRLMKFAGRARTLPSDMARNHDHYLHGRPKE